MQSEWTFEQWAEYWRGRERAQTLYWATHAARRVQGWVSVYGRSPETMAAVKRELLFDRTYRDNPEEPFLMTAWGY